ncbi:ASCH domain-containing protein [Haploplasma axanthum]|uniref:Uncharacterized conserved protein n=1 Tax=Haploplasma axanthum TaxID=29552 RepID=A0A449BCB8_HAPAX|nr:hypothetical protein [Haploplasma axanthum]VEU79960.1 Uncharacterized conserved protein [Haploplasma axanthum]
MNYKMKIQDKYIMPIKNRIKTKEYRLYDEERQKIKIGDVLLFAAKRVLVALLE